MTREPAYQRFEVLSPQGRTVQVEFKKAGFLTAGDQPELFFFRLDSREVIICISGEALWNWQHFRRHLSREEKIDVTGLFLKQRMMAGMALVPENLFLGPAELERLLRELGFSS